MSQDLRYALASVEHAPELSRLQKLQAINDPATLSRLDEIGVAAGWRCLEVGAGAGSIARAWSSPAAHASPWIRSGASPTAKPPRPGVTSKHRSDRVIDG